MRPLGQEGAKRSWGTAVSNCRAHGEAAGAGAEVGHAEVDGGRLSCPVSHGRQLLCGGGHGGLNGGDLAEPALVPGFLKAVDEVD